MNFVNKLKYFGVLKNFNAGFYSIDTCKEFHNTCFLRKRPAPQPLRNLKPKSKTKNLQYFVDVKQVRTVGGQGGEGMMSFLQLFANDAAGPDGGDGGNGGHIIFKVSQSKKDLAHIKTPIVGIAGENGRKKNCFGKNAEHTFVPVPVGTIVRNINGDIVGDLSKDGMMFVAARGGGGGRGNAFFKSDALVAPTICEYGALGENIQYVLEIRSMAHIGLIGLPNAGKSTLLRAISRARPKVADYAFTTLKPHLGIVEYDDYEQIIVADLPGLIEDSHKNKGLGVTFLKHAERCAVLLYMLDITIENPWEQLQVLQYETIQYSKRLQERPILVVANKMDFPEAEENLKLLREKINMPVVPISAKHGKNISTLLAEIRLMYDKYLIDNPRPAENSESS